MSAITPQPGIIRASIYLDPTVGASEDLRLKLNAWLNHSQEFSVIRERLKENLRRDDIIRVILQAEDPILRKLPWQLWNFFERYPNAELALSTPSFEEPLTVTPRNKVRILAILGNSKGIDIKTDRRLLQEKLGNTEILFLKEPSRQELNDQLWDDKGWDILFFAGHGESDGETGIIHINNLESLTIPQLNKALTKAIQRGLRWAIFNSCDGLGLEFALKQLWAEATKHGTRQLTNDAYDQIGGIERALGIYAEEVYCRLREEYKLQKRQIKRIFTQLVRPGETTATEHTRRLATRRELGEENWELVNRLNSEDVRLVVIGHDEATNEETVEVVHEALIRGWERLRNWVKKDLEFRTWQERLRKEMRDWENGGNKKDDLLRGTSLDVAKGWLEKRPEDINARERLFIEKGLELRDRQRQKEEERRQRELEAARELAEESEARRREEAKARKASQIMNIVAFIAIALVSAAAIFTWFQWNKTQLQSKNQAIQIEITKAGTMLELDKLIESLKVAKQLQKLQHLGEATDDTVLQVSKGLQQAVDSVREKNRLIGHEGKVNSVSFTPDKQTIATASADNTVKLWQQDGILITTITGHSDEVLGVAFSPDGQTIASASADNTVKLWRRDGTLIKTITGHNAQVYAVSFSPNGEIIATASADKTVKLWQQDGILITTLTGHSDEVLGVAFSPDGETIATASADNTVKLWRRDGTLIKTITGHNDQVYAVSFSPDGETIATASEDNTVKLWKPDGRLIKPLTGHRYRVHGVSFSPDGQIIATASGDNTVKLWRRDGSLMYTLTGHGNEVLQVSFSPDGQTIATTSADKTVKLWELKYSIGHKAPVWDLSIRKDKQTIVTASEDKTIKLWNLDGSFITTFTDDTIGGDTAHKAGVTDVDFFSPDGQTFVSASEDKTIKLWSYDEKRRLKTLTGHTAGVNGVIFNPKNKQIIASASKDKTVRIWNVSNGSSRIIGKHDAEVSDVAFSPDAKIIASASWDNTIKFWDVNGKLMKTLTGHTAGINDITYSRDGKFLASGSSDTTVKIWRVSDYKLIATLKSHSAGITDVNFSPDGQRIISASDDKTIKFWDWQKETLIDTRNRHSAGVTDVNMSKDKDGQIIASASTDGTVVVWNWTLKLDDLLKQGCALAKDYLKNPNNGMNENDPQRQICDGMK